MDENQLSEKELHLLVAQFAGQQVGELKGISNNIVGSSVNLRPLELNVDAVFKQLPKPTQITSTRPSLTQEPQVNITATSPVQMVTTVKQPANDNQIEFNFKYDIMKDLVDKMELILKQNKKILQLLEEKNEQLSIQSSSTFKLKKNP